MTFHDTDSANEEKERIYVIHYNITRRTVTGWVFLSNKRYLALNMTYQYIWTFNTKLMYIHNNNIRAISRALLLKATLILRGIASSRIVITSVYSYA